MLMIFSFIFFFLLARKPYNVSTFDARHFCSFEDPPCTLNECRVATHIIAGLYPLNFSKFLIKAYQPLNEEERKELMNIQKLYFSYLMQKLCDDKTKKVDPLHQMDLLWNIDDTDYTLFCDIGSAFAECYLIDVPIPVQELLDSCFLIDNNDIELNMYWLECIYMFKESGNSPLKKIENDPKVLELQLRMQMDQISLSKAKLKAHAQFRGQGQLDTEPQVPSNNSPTCSPTHLVESASAVTICLTPPGSPPPLDDQVQFELTETLYEKHNDCDRDSLKENDPSMADAIKITVKQKLNQ